MTKREAEHMHNNFCVKDTQSDIVQRSELASGRQVVGEFAKGSSGISFLNPLTAFLRDAIYQAKAGVQRKYYWYCQECGKKTGNISWCMGKMKGLIQHLVQSE